MDLEFAVAFVSTLAVFVLAVLWANRKGRITRHERVERAGSSAFLGKASMNAFYGLLLPIVTVLRRLGVSANAVTMASLALGLGAAALLATGHFGIAALVTGAAAVCDAADGQIARDEGTASAKGALLDTTVDRYVELAFFIGLAIHYRFDVAMLVLVLGALAGSFMVSYASAKIDSSGLAISRGSMRRAERLVYLVGGIVLVPITSVLAPRWGSAPLAFVLALVTIVGNASAIARLRELGAAMTHVDS